MGKLLWVGLGGAVGAICRYLIGRIPVHLDFPVLTLLTNMAGAVLIGVVTGLALRGPGLSDAALLFWKTGVCGGFTTFSFHSSHWGCWNPASHSGEACISCSASGAVSEAWRSARPSSASSLNPYKTKPL